MTRRIPAVSSASLAAACVVALAAGASGAQTVAWRVLDGTQTNDERPTGVEVSSGTSATLSLLDKVSGEVRQIVLGVGATIDVERFNISLIGCRFPTDNPNSDAFVYLRIVELPRNETVFDGWMIASSPALNALDHPRYDIWALDCT